MNPDVNPVAEPSAAAPIQYDSWDEKGTPIVSAKTQPSKQDSAPAASGEEKPVNAAESGAAKVQESKEGKGKLSAEQRKEQLNSEIRELVAKRDQLKSEVEAGPKRDVKAEPSPAKPVNPTDTLKAELAALKKPNINDFKGDDAWEKYESAKDEYQDKRSDLRAAIAKAEAVQEARAEQQKAEADRRFNEQLAKTKERHPDFDDVAKPAALKLWNDPAVPQGIKDRLAHSPLLMDVMYVLGGDEKQFSDFIDTAKTDPVAAIEKLGVIQHLIRETLSKSTPEAGKETPERGADGKFKANSDKETPAKPKPSAPEPVAIVGGRGTPGEDALVEAAKANRFSDFEAEQWRRVKSSRQ